MEVGIGVDMGGTRIKIGLVRQGKLLADSTIDALSHVSLAERLVEIADRVDQLLKDHNCVAAGIGIAFPGIVDHVNCKVLSKYVKYPDAQDVDFIKWAKERWNIPVALLNDAKAALLGEWQYGNGVGCRDLVLVTLGTGVGSGVMIDSKLLSGRNFVAGNLGGHMTINVHGKECNCGNIGCLETEASAWTLREERDIDFKTLFDRAAKGDELAMQVQSDCLKAWSLGIISLIHAFDPERIVIGGGIMQSGDIVLAKIREMIVKHSWVKNNPPEVVAAAHPDFAGILGMYYMVTSPNKVVSVL
jgi:glucokinase